MEIPAFADLLDLQEVDLEIDRLLERRQNLPELEQYRQANAERSAAEERRDALVQSLRELELELDKSEGELEILEGRFDEAETRLFAGGMSSKETENKRLEVRSLDDQKGRMEERVLELLDQRDELQNNVTESQRTVASARAKETGLEELIKNAWADIDRQLARNEAKKGDVVQPIPQDLVDMYEKLRGTKEGVAIGRLENGQCGGCHLTLSSAEQVAAAETDPPRCVHCRRLIVL